MDKPQSYSNALAFKAALEQRLKNEANKLGRPYPVLRKLVAFERLLARVFNQPGAGWALKGGYALELRLGQSRTTQDVDLVLNDPNLLKAGKDVEPQLFRSLLQMLISKDLGDFFAFRLDEPTPLKAATIAGSRIPVEALIGGVHFENFKIDVALAETDPAPTEKLTRSSWLAFAGFAQVDILAIPESLQFAEKLHAYTFPWSGRENTREKDLLDMVIMIQRGILPQETHARIMAVFKARNTHDVPSVLESPPAAWGPVFNRIAKESGFVGTIDEAFGILARFYESLFKI